MGEAGQGSGGLEMISRRGFIKASAQASAVAVRAAPAVGNFEFKQNQNKLRWASEYEDYHNKYGIGLEFTDSNGDKCHYAVQRRVTWEHGSDVPIEIERNMKAEVLRWIRRVV